MQSVIGGLETRLPMLSGTTSVLGHLDAEELGCNSLIARLDSDEDRFVMPPGAPLPAAERCAVRQWVDAGAPR